MGERLSYQDIDLLCAALKRDKLEIGWFRPWFWRRGWMVPPSFYLPVPIDEWIFLGGVFGVLFGLGFRYLVEIIAFYLAWLLLPACWRSRRDVRPLGWLIILALVLLLAATVFSCWPESWPNLNEIMTAIDKHAYVASGYLVWVTLKHWDNYCDRKVRRWADYVEQALVRETF